GYDCPDIECVYCVRPTQSSTLWLQMTGRVLRTGALKPTAVIIDVTDNWLKHGLPDEPRQWSLQPKTVLSLSDGWGKKCPSCTHVFKPLSSELEILSAEIGADGLLIRHHSATCPSCGGQVEFTTKESTQSDAPAIYRIKIRNAITLDITEVDLTSNTQKLELIRKMLYQQGLKNQPPAKIYKAIFMGFIENINEFTLGDWREIVKMIEPSEPIITKKAWELYQESLVRYKNRQMALSFIEKRNNQNQNGAREQKVPTSSGHQAEQVEVQQSKSSEKVKTVGNPYFQNKYAEQWKESLANMKAITAEFLTNNAGLFHVEIQRKNVNISLEIKASPNLKSQMKEAFDEQEIQAALSLGFGKAAIVMVRLAN
nr:ATP-dependent helicase [Nostocaceae cyanobacterium]